MATTEAASSEPNCPVVSDARRSSPPWHPVQGVHMVLGVLCDKGPGLAETMCEHDSCSAADGDEGD